MPCSAPQPRSILVSGCSCLAQAPRPHCALNLAPERPARVHAGELCDLQPPPQPRSRPRASSNLSRATSGSHAPRRSSLTQVPAVLTIGASSSMRSGEESRSATAGSFAGDPLRHGSSRPLLSTVGSRSCGTDPVGPKSNKSENGQRWLFCRKPPDLSWNQPAVQLCSKLITVGPSF
jgi:hypothetical protein